MGERRGLRLALALAGVLSASGVRETAGNRLDVGVPRRDVHRGWLWVPIDEAFDPWGRFERGAIPEYMVQGYVNRAIFEPGSEFLVRAIEAVERDGSCPFMVGYHADRIAPRPNSTLPELVRSADGIFEGTIAALHPGFFVGRPGVILEVRAASAIKGASVGRALLFYPRLLTRAGPSAVCLQDPSYPLNPKAGESVIFFTLDEPLNRDGSLFAPEPSELIFFDPQGAIREPSHQHQVPAGIRTRGDLVGAIRALLAQPLPAR